MGAIRTALCLALWLACSWMSPCPLAGEEADAGPTPPSDLVGMGFSGEVFRDTPNLFPRLKDAGVGWVRVFPEWAAVQPKEGEWNWQEADALVERARKNRLRICGMFCYFAPWASSCAPGEKGWGPQTRTFPVRNMQFWRDYVKACVSRYKNDIRAWEVWNEPNSPAFNVKGTPKDYADLVREACAVARQIDPKIKIGLTCASFDVGYLDQVIAQGAVDHFDFVAVHPYNSVSFLFGHEPSFLRMAGNLRRLLEKHKQRKETELWITEIGLQTTGEAAAEQRQAEALAKAFLLGAAQGFSKVFWFEAKGPSYGKEGDFSILRADDSPRPSGKAVEALARTLGNRRYAGWLSLEGKGYGFVFDGKGGPVLAAWAPPGAGVRLRFPAAVTVVDMTGTETDVPAGAELALATMPVLVKHPPAPLVETARSQAAKPFPWGTDYAGAPEVWCRLGPANTSFGLVQKEDAGDGVTVTGVVDGQEFRRTDKANRKFYIYFDVDNTYAAFGDHDLEITVVARRPPGRNAGMNLTYESAKGYRNTGQWWTIPGDDRWYERTYRITDANFVDTWGWNFRIEAPDSPADVWVKEVRVKRTGAKK